MQRSIRRAQQRRQDAARRRESLRRRRIALAAIGASAVFAPPAQAAVVDTTVDSGPGSLRQAILDTNASDSDDTITFDPTLTGTIQLTSGELEVNPSTAGDTLTITGPGRTALTVSGGSDGDTTPEAGESRIFDVLSNSGAVSISGLTLTDGITNSTPGGGAVNSASSERLTIADAAITDSIAAGFGGGGITSSGPLTVTGSTLSGNMAVGTVGGGAIDYINTGSGLAIAGSTITGNSAQTGGGIRTSSEGATITGTTISANNASGSGAGIATSRNLTLTESTVSGNIAVVTGGGVYVSSKYGGFSANNSTITNNDAAAGGGIAFSLGSEKYSARNRISQTTISGNDALDAAGPGGGGILVGSLGTDDRLNVVQSTVSGNTSAARGGGIALPSASVRGEMMLTDSTVSGNTAVRGGGLSAGDQNELSVVGEKGSIALDNSTIASNTASTSGGGIYLAQYTEPDGTAKLSPTIAVTSTIVADNAAAGAANDADRIDTSTAGGLDLAFALVETPGDAPAASVADRPSILGVDPQLGALADNGGATATHLPAATSPAVDKGFAPARPGVDQRGQTRTVDGTGVDNAVRGDGSDIGAVELQNPPVRPPDPPPPEPDLLPRAVIAKNKLAARKAKNRLVQGTATDDNGVVRVEVAIVRKVRGRCASMRASGNFSRGRACDVDPRFLAAQGTTAWRFKAPKRLKRGNYIVYARAVDTAGQVQTSFGAASVDPFRVGR